MNHAKKDTHRKSPPGQRQQRVAAEIRHALFQILERSRFDNLAIENGNFTIIDVHITPDLKNVRVSVLPLGGNTQDNAEKTNLLVEALNDERPRLRHALARRVYLKYAPDLHFVADQSLNYRDSIEQLLNSASVRKDLPSHE